MMNRCHPTTRNQRGYMLLSVMLLITIMLIVLAATAPRIAQQIKRSKEEELVNRGTQYAIAIKKFFHKTGNYPTSLEQLEDTNHLRFLRKKYTDPMTGEANWRAIHMGEAEIPISQSRGPGLAGGGNLGSLNTAPGGQQNTLGNPTQPNPPPPSTGFTPPSGQQATLQQSGGGNQLGALTTQNISNGLGGTGQQLGGGAIIGVASVSKGTGIKEFNGKSSYDEWLFIYDPRLEQAAAGAGGIGGSATAGVVVAAPRGAGGTSGGTGGAGGTSGNAGNGGVGQTPPGTPTPAPALPH